MAYRIRYRTRLRWTRCLSMAAVCVLTAVGFWLMGVCLETANTMWRDESWYLALARLAGQMIREAH